MKLEVLQIVQAAIHSGTVNHHVSAKSVAELKASIFRHMQNIQPETLNATVDHAILYLQHVIDM